MTEGDQLAEAELYLDEEPARAVDVAEELCRTAADDHLIIGAARLGAQAARHLNDLERSDDFFRIALERCRPESYDAARIKISIAGNAAMAGDFSRAHQLLSELAATSALGTDRYLITLQRASILTVQGRHADAVDEFDRLLDETDLEPSLLAHVLLDQGSCLVQLGRLSRGRDHLARALAWYESQGDQRSQLQVLSNLVICEAWSGDPEAALALSERAEAMAQALGVDDGLTRLDEAKAFLGAGLGAEAEWAVTSAIESLEFNGNVGWIADAYATKAAVYLALDRPREASTAADRAVTEAVRQNNDIARLKGRRLWLLAMAAGAESVDYGEALLVADELIARGHHDQAQELTTKLALAAYGAGRTEDCRRLAGKAAGWTTELPSSAINANVASALEVLADGDPDQALGLLDEALAAVARHRWSLSATELRARATSVTYDVNLAALAAAFATKDPDVIWAWTERLRALTLEIEPDQRSRSAEVGEALTELRIAAVRARDRGQGDVDHQAAVAAAQHKVEVLLRAAHPARSVDGATVPASQRPLANSLTFVEHDGWLHRIDADRRGRTELRTGIAPLLEVRRHIENVRRDWRRWLRQRSDQREAATIEQALDAALADLDQLLRLDVSSQSVAIVVSESLHGAPWTALPSLAGRTVSVGPSMAILGRPPTAVTYQQPEVVLAAGPELANAELELTNLAAIWPSAAVFGPQESTVDRLMEAMAASRVVHFAAHGSFRPEASMFSGLDLADGPLTAVDLERVNVAPEIAVLSACDAGMATVLPGNETLGMASALLGAGCRAVIAPVLPVADEDCRAVMTSIHRGLADGLAPAAALCQAAKAFAPESAEGRLVGSFVCFGGG